MASGRNATEGHVGYRRGHRSSFVADSGLVEAAQAALAGDELTPVTRSMIEELLSELTAARARIAELESQAIEDPLVPILNRRGFMRELERAIAFVDRYGTPVGLIYLDIDNLKQVNDAYGHAAGDAALRTCGMLLRDNVRASDSVGRIGGDEFAVLLWNACEEDVARKGVELADLIEAQSIVSNGRTFRLSASTGGTSMAPGDAPETLLEMADQAMYAVKRERRSRR